MAAHRLAKWVEGLEQQSRLTRIALLVVVHLVIFSAAYLGAFLVRFDFRIPAEMTGAMWAGLPLVLAVKVGIFGALKMFQGWWRYMSLYDAISLAYALAIAAAVVVGLHGLWWRPDPFPRSIYVLDFMVSLVALTGLRGALRLVRETAAANDGTGSSRNLLIVGAGDLGDLLVREITRAQGLAYRPVAFLDDHPSRRGLRLHGIPIDGPLTRLGAVVQERGVEEIIIALPADEQHKLRQIVELARRCEIQPKILPAVETVLDDGFPLGRVREVSITDLLGREPVELDLEALGRFIEGQRVLVTGAGGSIGAELCRQILRFSPAHLAMVDSAETPLFEIHRELAPRHGDLLKPWVADVGHQRRMERLFAAERPQIVLHAAAYKHVPLMEAHPAEAVENNVLGTRVLADLSARFAVDTFVLISTDKAVNPTSVMGATKRIAELYLRRLDQLTPTTRFCAVRFGNVLGSNGSVVPIFRDQIRRGGPVTVTHPKMTRYFMTIPEAVQLVLQAAAFDDDHHLFILDMGEPVRIADLARDMIRLSGHTPDQVPIKFTGIRPGEKLFEELTLDREVLDTTSHEKIFVGQRVEDGPPDFEIRFAALVRAARTGDDRRVRRCLGRLVPEYSGASPPSPRRAAR